jgi:hypothetical protein
LIVRARTLGDHAVGGLISTGSLFVERDAHSVPGSCFRSRDRGRALSIIIDRVTPLIVTRA